MSRKAIMVDAHWHTSLWLASLFLQPKFRVCPSRHVCFAILSQAHSVYWHRHSRYRKLRTLMPMPCWGEDATVDGRSIWPPIHSLPPEILSEIFMLLPPSCTEWYDVLDMSRPPWSFGHVCSSWRSNIISSCWSLWSNPWIPFSNANDDIELCDPLSLLQTALEQSGNHLHFGSSPHVMATLCKTYSYLCLRSCMLIQAYMNPVEDRH